MPSLTVKLPVPLYGAVPPVAETDTVVVFAFIHKPRRGYYEAVFSLAEKDPSSFTEQQLTEKFVRYLEEVIRQYPDMWLWSHRRWKWEWKPEYGEIIN